MSALPPKADIGSACWDVRFVPKTFAASFDHLVGAGEQCWRHFEAERLSSFQIDDQFEARWLLHWQIGGIVTAENAAGVNADLAIDMWNADTVAYQTACRGKFAKMVDSRQSMTGRQSNKFVTSSVEKWGRRQYQGFHAFPGGDFKGALDLPIRTGAQNLGLEIDDRRGLLKFIQLRRIGRKIRVEKQTDVSDLRHHLVQ